MMPRQRRESMFNHVMIGTNDIERSKRFYDAVLGTLGGASRCAIKQVLATPGSFTDTTGAPFVSASRSTARRQPLPTAAPSALSATRPSKFASFTTLRLHMVANLSRTRRVCAKAAWGRCTWLMCVIPMATSSAQSIAPSRIADPKPPVGCG